MGSTPTDGVAQAAHDLLNLLNVVRSYTGLVQAQVDDATLGEYLERVQAAVDKATVLTQELQEVGDEHG